ncbi:uncharacterized protein LOC120339841 isoform X1 [Styela clava]
MMDGSGGHTDVTEMNSQQVFGPVGAKEGGCPGWTPARMFLEVFLVLMLVVNLFSAFVIFTTKSTLNFHSTFNKVCILMINFSGIALCSHFSFLPLLFSPMMTQNTDTNGFHRYIDLATTVSFNVQDQAKTELQWCNVSETASCKWSGFSFTFLVFSPLAILVAMSADRVVATYCWKTYKFRGHAVSSFRLTVLIGFLATLCLISVLPFLNIGATYKYDSILLVCVLPRDPDSALTRTFALIVTTFIAILLFFLILAGCLTLSAVYLNSNPRFVSSNIGSSLVFGRFGVVKSEGWKRVSRLTLAVSCLGLASFIPLLAISFYRLFHELDETKRENMDIATTVFLLLVPCLNPVIYIGFSRDYKNRAIRILSWIKPKRFRSNISSTMDHRIDSNWDSEAEMLPNHRNIGTDFINTSQINADVSISPIPANIIRRTSHNSGASRELVEPERRIRGERHYSPQSDGTRVNAIVSPNLIPDRKPTEFHIYEHNGITHMNPSVSGSGSSESYRQGNINSVGTSHESIFQTPKPRFGKKMSTEAIDFFQNAPRYLKFSNHNWEIPKQNRRNSGKVPEYHYHHHLHIYPSTQDQKFLSEHSKQYGYSQHEIEAVASSNPQFGLNSHFYQGYDERRRKKSGENSRMDRHYRKNRRRTLHGEASLFLSSDNLVWPENVTTNDPSPSKKYKRGLRENNMPNK